MRYFPLFAALAVLIGSVTSSLAQDRDTKVRDDRAEFRESEAWVYNDFDAAVEAARESGKPILGVLRCVP